MVAIRTSALSSKEILWQELIPGRLLRVRAEIGRQQWEILSLYQHAITSASAEERVKLMERRRAVLTKLDKVLSEVPLRSMILLGGDFNMSLLSQPPLVGHGVITGASATDLEQERLVLNELLAKHRLTVLNSWGKKKATYEHPTGCTQIDFLVVRQQVADSEAKKSGPVDSGLAGWRHSGHRLLSGNMRLQWRPWQHRQSPLETRKAHTAVTPGDEAVSELRTAVKQRCPGRESSRKLPPLQEVTTEIECHWRLRAQLSQLQCVHILRHAFQAMKVHGRAQRAHRALKKACRQRKRQRLLNGLQQIEQEARSRDCKAFHTFVKLVGLVAPKPFVPKIKLRDERGMTMTKLQEGDRLREYASKLFHAADTDLPPMLPAPADIVSKQRWEWAILQVKKGKAVPAGSAQICTWQARSSEYAASLEAICVDAICASRPYIPSFWTRVQLAWLPKPGKTPSCPEHLRSIGLMEVDTKAFMVLLKAEAHPYVMAVLEHTPQFAYRSGVSA